MTTTPEHDEEDRGRDEVLAGEYVLGVLSLRERIEVENRMETDRGFAAIVAKWQGDLSDFDTAYEPVTPPADLLGKIERRLFQSEAAKRPGAVAGLWHSVVLWRLATFASLALLVTYAVVPTGTWPGLGGEPEVPLVATLSGPDAPVTLHARYDGRSGRLQMTPVAAAGPSEQRSLELWLVPGGDNPTISLGVLPQTGEGALVVPADLRDRIGEGATLAVSLEPFGGSPTGQATGPVIAVGQTRKP